MTLLSALYTLFGTYRCPVRAVTGLPCPGCGMTRALMYLLHGDVCGAFHMHPLIFTLPFIAALLIFGSERVRRYTAISAIVLFTAVYAARMILYFPVSEPMTYEHPSILHTLSGTIPVLRVISSGNRINL